MSPATFQRTLKQNVNRTVDLVCWDVEGRLVGHIVKRFHGTGLARRLFDGRRARREWDALHAVRASGLPTPEPVELRRANGHWELVTELLAGAVPLRLHLTGFAPLRTSAEQLARRLGTLVAGIAARGLWHSDLHSGNILIDEAGEPCLIDLAKARFGTPLDSDALEELLVQLAADAREFTTPRQRARFLVALLRALPATRAQSRADLAERIESRARLERRRIVKHAEERWSRRSSATRPFESGELSGFLRQDLSDADAQAAWSALETESEARVGRRLFLAVRGATFEDVRQQWNAAARLSMHAVPCARPAVLLTKPTPTAIFELPADSQRATDRAVPGDWLELLHDRGLTLGDDPACTLYTSDRGVSIGPGFELGDARG